MAKDIIDLSGPIQPGAEWYGPPCEPVSIKHIGSIEKEGWVSHMVHMTTISGTTYVETGAHLLADGPNLEAIPLARLVCEAEVWSCAVEGQAIQVPPQADTQASLQGRALVVISGWSRAWNQENFFHDSPYFSPSLQEAVLALAPGILVSDSVSFDAPDNPDMPFLKAYFRCGGIIVSPVCPERELPDKRGRLVVAPLKLSGVNSSPCRVFFEC